MEFARYSHICLNRGEVEKWRQDHNAIVSIYLLEYVGMVDRYVNSLGMCLWDF